MTPLTKEQAIVISGFTGHLCCTFRDLQRDVEKRSGRPVRIWEPDFRHDIKELYSADFQALCHVDTSKEPT